MESRKRQLVTQIQEQPIRTVELHPNLPDLYRKEIIQLEQILDDEVTRSQAFDIIRSLISHIEVHPGQKRGHCDVVAVLWPSSSPSPNKKRPPALHEPTVRP